MKHPFAVRKAAVQYYLSGNASLAGTARKFGVGQTPLSRWLRAFRQQGETGLVSRPPRMYSLEFRLRVVHYIMSKMGSYADASVHFSIPSDSVIGQWVKCYRKGGVNALTPARNGSPMPKDKFIPIEKPLSDMTHSELLKELEYLRAENAYLKKLSALREENALRALQKKQR